MSDEILQHDRTFKTYFLNAKRTWLFEIVSSSRMLVKEEEGEENTEHKCICICINKKNQCLILTLQLFAIPNLYHHYYAILSPKLVTLLDFIP